jgi:hypothetical protein
MTASALGRPVHVVSTKYDGSRHWEFDSFFVAERGPLLVTHNFAGQELTNPRGKWRTPFDTRNHFWSDRWYNVMRNDRPRAGGLEYWYCNVTTPARYDGETVRYIDLDLDVRVFADGTLEVLDEDEFLEHSVRMGYPPDVIEEARRAVDELIALARGAQFPFDLKAVQPT